MNNLIKLISLNAFRSIRRGQSPAASLRTLTTWSSLTRNHSTAFPALSSSLSPSLCPAVSSLGGVRASDSRFMFRNAPPFNCGIWIVREPMAVVVERYGKRHRTLLAGVHFLIPFIDRFAFEYSLEGEVLHMPHQRVLTQDNVLAEVFGDVYLEVVDPGTIAQCSFVEAYCLTQLIMRTEMAKVTLENAYTNRYLLSKNIKEAFNLSAPQGLKCTRCCINKILLPVGQPMTGQQSETNIASASSEDVECLVYECASFIKDVQGMIDLDSARMEELASQCSMTGQQGKTDFTSACGMEVEHRAYEFKRVIDSLQDRFDLDSGRREKVGHLLSGIISLSQGKTVSISASRMEVEHLASEFKRLTEALQDRLDLDSERREEVGHLLSDIGSVLKNLPQGSPEA